jgi:hypothetical protein
MNEPLSEMERLLAEHRRLLAQHGPESDPVYEFEMRYLKTGDLLWQMTEDRRRYTQRLRDRRFCLWLWVMLALLASLQAASIYLLFFRLTSH